MGDSREDISDFMKASAAEYRETYQEIHRDVMDKLYDKDAVQNIYEWVRLFAFTQEDIERMREFIMKENLRYEDVRAFSITNRGAGGDMTENSDAVCLAPYYASSKVIVDVTRLFFIWLTPDKVNALGKAVKKTGFYQRILDRALENLSTFLYSKTFKRTGDALKEEVKGYFTIRVIKYCVILKICNLMMARAINLTRRLYDGKDPRGASISVFFDAKKVPGNAANPYLNEPYSVDIMGDRVKEKWIVYCDLVKAYIEDPDLLKPIHLESGDFDTLVTGESAFDYHTTLDIFVVRMIAAYVRYVPANILIATEKLKKKWPVAWRRVRVSKKDVPAESYTMLEVWTRIAAVQEAYDDYRNEFFDVKPGMSAMKKVTRFDMKLRQWREEAAMKGVNGVIPRMRVTTNEISADIISYRTTLMLDINHTPYVGYRGAHGVPQPDSVWIRYLTGWCGLCHEPLHPKDDYGKNYCLTCHGMSYCSKSCRKSDKGRHSRDECHLLAGAQKCTGCGKIGNVLTNMTPEGSPARLVAYHKCKCKPRRIFSLCVSREHECFMKYCSHSQHEAQCFEQMKRIFKDPADELD